MAPIELDAAPGHARFVVALVACLLLSAVHGPPAWALVVVDDVDPAGLGRVVGIEEGRAFEAWQLLAPDGTVIEQGRLDDPFAFVAVRTELAPRGVVRLLGPGAGKRADLQVDLQWEEWGLSVRPAAHVDAGSSPRLRAWSLAEDADAHAERADDPAAVAAAVDSLFQRAIDIVGDEPTARAQLLRRWGDRARDRSDFDAARIHYETALEIDAARDPAGIAVARDHLRLASVDGRRRDLISSRQHYERAMAILRAEARPGPLLAEALGGMSFVLNLLGEMDEGEARADEALAIVDATGLQGRVARGVLNNRGTLHYRRGQYADASAAFDRVIEISEASELRDRITGNAYANRAACLRQLGDLEGAERSARLSLEIRRALAPESLDVAQSYQLLANILSSRLQNEAAVEMYEHSITIFERLAPDSYALAQALINLGAGLSFVDRLDETEMAYRRAVDILDRVAPGSFVHAQALRALGAVYRDLDRRDDAETITRRALEVVRSLAPGSLEVANILHLLGHDAHVRGDRDAALMALEESWEIRSRIAPGTRFAAEALFEIASIHEEEGAWEEAARNYCAAVDALDMLRTRYGGTEQDHVTFAKTYGAFADACIGARLALGDVDGALAVLERTRARYLSSLFAVREGLVESMVPADLSSRRLAHREAVDATLARLSQLGEGDEDQVASERERLAELEIERQEIAAALRLAAPRVDALEAFDTLDATEIAATLDRGTLFVTFWIGESESMGFVIEAGGVAEVFRVAMGRSSLSESVSAFRASLVGATFREKVDQHARALYDALLAPVAERLVAAERLLVSADGPLRVLPFAALRSPEGRYLVEDLPVHMIDSATLYARIVQNRRPFDPSRARVVAFGDPRTIEESTDGPAADPAEVQELAPTYPSTILALRERGFDLGPLPGTRQEIAVLRALFGDGVEAHVGSDATEGRAKRLDREIDILHFACHAVADQEIPSASALVLSVPRRSHDSEGRDNGLLQAWEVLEDVRVDAELVTLSACETALGKELGSEGMAGLTRAFQFAGARSIVASLWKLPDGPTARLMQVFYENLAQGMPKDESLRQAQLALLRDDRGDSSPDRALGGLAPADADAAEPGVPAFTWAALQLIGDWR